ncbi:ABC transporter ATP-binding protein [Rhodococcus fascians]|uniref:Putative multidrug export ATP-binding/permease protein n=1 Tax=Rhodococcoides fascians TaxID=1828 RepID=A0A143QTN9_RHOFA|nr:MULTISPECIES: ABC transporter ATP-binding protein [Rhodococcus]RZL77656.1 MAG: ABC transporter ATP-binding protein [Rhodococcus sp. (in: high G+C Gram-positive bacteria)]AMY25827.1 Putative multidrug export ATP-binding/permease protein [Rhodococcus fascians]KMJ49335.1 multidrug ABC transporter ATPase [Rhodococcus fascians]MBX5331814.1 ABC transporter ATP-binding protein [Rhodococcus fascians]MBY3793044.1 ABC transporter ATP-binding protein [Rhodococcus fascians]
MESRPERVPLASDPAPVRRVLALFTPYRRKIAVVSAIIVASAIIALASPLLLRELLDHAIPDRDVTLVSLIAVGMIAVAVATNTLGVVQTWMSNGVGQQLMHDLRVQVYSHLQRQSLGFFARTRTGEVQSRIANDIGGMQSVVTNTATSIAQNATTVAATVVALFLLDWKLATFSLIILPIFVRVARRIGDERRKISTKRQKLLSDLSVQIEESLSVSGILLGKTTGSAQALTDKFADRSHEVAGVELAAMMAGKWRMATIQISFAVMPALVYWFAGITIGQGSALTIGTLVAFTALQTQLFRPTMQLLNTGVEVQASLALFGRVFEYLDLPIDVAEPEHPVTLSRESVRGDVAFRGVDFTYAAATVPTLCNIDLDVPAGSTLALVGATGSGKTTLGYLVARLHDPTAGSVTIDGVDLRHLASENIADLVGVVSQETYLFHATIRENLRFAKPDATDDEIVAAARTAQIHDFIDGLDDGYDTMVGERGYRFSGGEKQRIAIARTVLRNPPILVLDEATSALDNRTERAVQTALDGLMHGRTTILIAHRLSTVRAADAIAVLDHGIVREVGSHEALLAEDGMYAQLVRAADDVVDSVAA